MNKKYTALFKSFYIGKIKIKNRLVQCPMDPGPFVKPDKTFNDKIADILIRRAQGGVGLIITGCCLIEKHNNEGMFADDAGVFIKSAKIMTDKVHTYDSRIFIQLSAGVGRNLVATQENIKEGLLDIERDTITPSNDTPNFWQPSILHHQIGIERIEKIINGFADAAEIAQKAGFDGVEVHALHEGYLLDQFAIKSINKRTDKYGGTLENRLRFTSEILYAIKRRCGNDFPVIIRFSVTSKMKDFNSGALPGEKYKEFGRSIEDSPDIAMLLEKIGYDALDTDNGSYDAWYWAHPPMYMPMLCNLSEAAFIKNFVTIPVICAGRMNEPESANKAVKSGKIDAVAIGRALLADPDWPNKVKKDCISDIRPCIACHNGCLRTFLNKPMTCALNPQLGDKDEGFFPPAKNQKKIAIIGGGIAGMEAARICSLRGHEIDLYEKSNQLGGIFIAAAQPDFKEADKKLIEWYKKQISKVNINVHFNSEITSNIINGIIADAIIIATGAIPRKLPVSIKDETIIVSAEETLMGKKKIGNNVVIIGGGLTGCEITYHLSLSGKKVSIIEASSDILQDPFLCQANSIMLRDLLNYYRVDIFTETTVSSFEKTSVHIKNKSFEHLIPADTIVLAIGYTPNKNLSVDDPAKLIYHIGDCKEVRNLMGTIEDAYKIATKL